MEISKKFTTETSHIVREASSIRCSQGPHGHSYKWFVSLEGPLAANGMIIDFKDLKPIKDFIDLFDHSMVFWEKENTEIVEFFKKHFCRILVMKKNTTAECMARLVFKFTQDWLSSLSNSPFYIEHYGGRQVSYNPIHACRVDVWETETGCGSATECDESDILIYTHNDKN